MKYVAIGDIHGCNRELKELLWVCRDYKNLTGPEVTYVFLGDYGDRGPNTKGVVETLMHFSTIENCVFLMGNHDEMLVDYLRGQYQWGYFQNGGGETLKSYGFDVQEKMSGGIATGKFPADHERWFRDLWVKYETPDFFFVHAGIQPHVPFAEQNRHDLMWIRHEFLNSEVDHGKLIIHGHTPGKTIDLRPNRCNLDTGCVFGGALSAGIFEDGKFIGYAQVKSEFNYLERYK